MGGVAVLLGAPATHWQYPLQLLRLLKQQLMMATHRNLVALFGAPAAH
jgi:hypothetical protein